MATTKKALTKATTSRSRHAAKSGAAAFDALDLLLIAVVLVDQDGCVVHANLAAESLLDVSRRNLTGQPLATIFDNAADIELLVAEARDRAFGHKRTHLTLLRAWHEPLVLDAVVQVIDEQPGLLASFELREIDQQLRVDREERLLDLSQANKELIRNLAHEIKNPLGGIRGAAQLLDRELPHPDLREYTQVIVKEADRLQSLVDRLLAPHRKPHIKQQVNIHEVCERVRSVVLAEYPNGLRIVRDYDISLPEFSGDKEQLIQAVLNIVHNAAQVMDGQGQIILRTRVVRQVTIAKRRYRLALVLHVIDSGPGIPEEIRDRIFYPLVTGRTGGSGLGLTLAQTFVHQHGGTIEWESRPGLTDFRILLPLTGADGA